MFISWNKDKRKGFFAGFKRLGPVNKTLVYIALAGIIFAIVGFIKDASKADIEKISKRQDEIWEEVRPKQEDIAELDKLNRLNYDLMDAKIYFAIIADNARWYLPNGGDYASYNTLWELIKKKHEYKDFLMGEIIRINNALRASYSTVRKIPLCKHGKNIGNRCLEVETEKNFDVSNVLSQLSHPEYWISRAKSAYLLQYLTLGQMKKNSIGWEEVLGKLVGVFYSEILNEDCLLTKYMAWEAFRRHTCFADEDTLFNVDHAVMWWNDQSNRGQVLNALENGRISPFCK